MTIVRRTFLKALNIGMASVLVPQWLVPVAQAFPKGENTRLVEEWAKGVRRWKAGYEKDSDAPRIVSKFVADSVSYDACAEELIRCGFANECLF